MNKDDRRARANDEGARGVSRPLVVGEPLAGEARPEAHRRHQRGGEKELEDVGRPGQDMRVPAQRRREQHHRAEPVGDAQLRRLDQWYEMARQTGEAKALSEIETALGLVNVN